MSASYGPSHRPLSSKSSCSNPFTEAEVYYGDRSRAARSDTRNRTFSAVLDGTTDEAIQELRHRRGSADALGGQPRSFLVPVEATLKKLLAAEDTDGNTQITIDDDGPKVLSIGTARSGGYRRTDVRGTYMLSNLLQELTLAQDYGRKVIELDESRLSENPVDRLDRMIRDSFWKNLTRVIDGRNIASVAQDPKDWTDDPRPRVYVPPGAPEQHAYYSRIAREHPDIRLDVCWLPRAQDITAEYIRDLNAAPGLLAVAMDEHATADGGTELRGKPFVVPGGRFNELYGWDSYMISLGLLLVQREGLARAMVEHFCFCIQHYGKILNANRSYYLGRSQPPFLTDMTLRVYSAIRHEAGALEFLRRGILAAVKEYYGVWVAEPRFDARTKLSRYRPIGVGVPPETEASHFVHVLTPYARRHGMAFREFVHAYDHGLVREPELDEYFLHDRAIRESGHDTSYRLERVAADLATVDLNACLYKIETDIARTIRHCFGDRLVVPHEFLAAGVHVDQVETSATWDRRARTRRLAMDRFMWDDAAGMYFDYDTRARRRTGYESATTFWAMWAGVPTPRQAGAMVIKALPLLEELGGLASGTERSRGRVGVDRPNRQWDYPFGWAPQQMLAWIGLQRYGYDEEAVRLAYKWLYMVTRAFVDFNGVVVEKYDVTQPGHPHKVAAEYGNQGADFKGVPREGFGWVNASYTYGLSMLDAHARRALGTLTDWQTYHRAVSSLGADLDDGGVPESEHLDRSHTGLHHEMRSPPSPSLDAQAFRTAGLGTLPRSRASRASHVDATLETLSVPVPVPQPAPAPAPASVHQKAGSSVPTSGSSAHSSGSSAARQTPEQQQQQQQSRHDEFEQTKARLKAEGKEHLGQPRSVHQRAAEEP